MTIAFDAKAALLTVTKANPAFSALVANAAIWDSAYVGRERPRQLIWYGETTWDTDESIALGNLRRDESFVIRLGIEIHDGDETQTIANEKAETLLNAIYEMLRDIRALGLPNLIAVNAMPLALGEGMDPSGRAALLAANVRIRARI